MKNLLRFAVISALLALVSVLMVAPAAAQDEDDEGEGGIVVRSTFGAGPDTFSPIYCTDAACNDVVGYMYINLVGIDPEIEGWAAGVPGALAESLELQEDGRTYILNLRTDMTWSDGTPITIDDVMYKWEIMGDPDGAYPYPYYVDTYIESVTPIDDTTLEVVFYDAFCGSVDLLSSLAPVPKHVFEQYDIAELQDIEYNLAPDVTSGPFLFGDYRTNEFTVLRGWDDYVDATLGYINPTGVIQRVVADQTVLMEDFMSPNGQINIMEGPAPDRKQEIRDRGQDGTGEYQVYTFSPGDSWDYMAFNLADPTNPQPALDEDGNHIDQGYHPIFTDPLVRQGLTHAVNIDAVIEGAVFGEGDRMAAQIVPGSWAYDDSIVPRAYDTEVALSLLAEAGWVPENPDEAAGPDNLLVCDGCLYATEVDPDFAGTAMEFELITNAGNTRREAIATVIQDELAQIGVTVNTNFIEFNTLIDRVFGVQDFDTYILGWRAGYPNDPDTTQLFGAESDDPESQGSNPTSFYNEEYFELEAAALDPAQTNGCDREARAEIYAQMQQIMYDENPYMWLYVQNGMYVARSNVIGFDPYPGLIDWNVDEWAVVNP